MPANGRWDLIRRLKVILTTHGHTNIKSCGRCLVPTPNVTVRQQQDLTTYAATYETEFCKFISKEANNFSIKVRITCIDGSRDFSTET